MCGMTHWLWHALRRRALPVKRFMCDVIHSCVWQDAFMCDMTHCQRHSSRCGACQRHSSRCGACQRHSSRCGALFRVTTGFMCDKTYSYVMRRIHVWISVYCHVYRSLLQVFFDVYRSLFIYVRLFWHVYRNECASLIPIWHDFFICDVTRCQPQRVTARLQHTATHCNTLRHTSYSMHINTTNSHDFVNHNEWQRDARAAARVPCFTC